MAFYELIVVLWKKKLTFRGIENTMWRAISEITGLEPMPMPSVLVLNQLSVNTGMKMHVDYKEEQGGRNLLLYGWQVSPQMVLNSKW